MLRSNENQIKQFFEARQRNRWPFDVFGWPMFLLPFWARPRTFAPCSAQGKSDCFLRSDIQFPQEGVLVNMCVCKSSELKESLESSDHYGGSGKMASNLLAAFHHLLLLFQKTKKTTEITISISRTYKTSFLTDIPKQTSKDNMLPALSLPCPHFLVTCTRLYSPHLLCWSVCPRVYRSVQNPFLAF